MSGVLIALFVILGAALGTVVFYFLSKKGNGLKEDGGALLMLQNQIQELTRAVDRKMGESTKILQSQFGESAKIIRDVTERLTKLDETNRQVIGFAEQLQKLEEVLKNPKQRGILGEYYLETLLKNVFPPGMYKMQYQFKDGTVVDAVIFVKDKIIPIDSKFSLENYNRVRDESNIAERERLEKIFKQDLKNRIDETAKYIKPEERTLDFAFMFIPAEGIYYDLLVNQVGTIKTNTRDLIEYAFIDKKVHIVSPTTFLSHLKMVLYGLNMMKIEESVEDVLNNVRVLTKHLSKYQESFYRIGKNLGSTVNSYKSANKEFIRIDKDVLKISSKGIGVEEILLDKPIEDTE